MDDYYTIETAGHHSELFAELHTLQKQGVLCDVILAAEDGEIMAHKVILMAASKYFREKLSPLVSANPSRICLKGISVVELANLVKYIYTGKLLVAKDTMDVTLEVSEILELTGVTQGYKDIISYEQMQTEDEVDSATGENDLQEICFVEPPRTGTKDSDTAVDKENQADNYSNSEAPGASDTACETPENVTAQPQEVRVTEYFQDGTSRIYTADHLEQAPSGTGHTSNEYQFEFNPYDQQYMDVSVGANNQVTSSTNMPRLQKMVAPEQRVSDEQARHQDLLTVAIETLSDPSHFIGGIPKHIGETETFGSSVNTESLATTGTQSGYQNGKVESKIVTLNAGTVVNELGGQTSVYTVALDLSSIKKPLVMPRVLRKKTEKEKHAEMTAKMYRKKKADLLNRTTIATPVAQPEDTTVSQIVQYHTVAKTLDDTPSGSISRLVDSSFKARRIPTILMRSSSPRKKEMVQQDQLQHIMIHRSQDGKVTTSKKTRNNDEKWQSPIKKEDVEALSENAKGEFGQVVNFDSDNDENEGKERSDQSVGKFSTEKVTEDALKAEAHTDHDVSSIAPETGEKQNVTTIRTRGTVRKETEDSNDSLESQGQSSMNVPVNRNMKSEDSESEMTQSPDRGRRDDNKSPEFDSHDSQIADRTRSSATKRKGKVPRRLPLNEDSDNKNIIPLVRTRKNSRTETVTGTGRNVRTRARSVNLESTDTSKEINKDFSEITSKDLECSNIQDNICDSNEIEIEEIQCSTDTSTEKQETWEMPEASLKSVRQDAQNQGMHLEIAETRKPTTDLTNTDDVKSKIFADNDSNSGDSFNESSDFPNSTHDIEIDLEMTVDSIDNSRDKSESVKRKVDDNNQDMSVKRSKSAEELTDCGKIGGDKTRQQQGVASKSQSSPGRVMYLCPEDSCNYSGYALSSVRKHQSAIHGQVGKSRKLPTAYLCKDEMKLEQVDFSQKEALTCGCCNIMFKSEAELQAHMDMMTVCVDCEERFNAEFDLLCHRCRAHGQPVPKTATSYSCPVCGYIDYTFKSIDKHMATHDGCHIQCICCDKCFKTFAEMKKHLVTHSDKRYKCSICDFMSNVLACVTIHQKLKHTVDKELAQCRFCNYKTPLIGNLRKHMLTGHELIVVTKQSHENREKFKEFEEGTVLTLEGIVFDPETMKVPKMSQRKFLDESKDKKTEAKRKLRKEEKSDSDVNEKRRKPALYKLSPEEFTKEVLKRHEEYLKKPEKTQRFMSQNLAHATVHPSFPQASPSVRRTKADKIYNAQKATPRFQDLSSQETQEYVSEAAASNVPTADNEIEVIHHESAGTVVPHAVEGSVQTVLAIPETSPGTEMEQVIVVTNDGKEAMMPTKDFYHALMQRENTSETKETIGVINALLAAGQEVQIEEHNIRHVEIQNE